MEAVGKHSHFDVDAFGDGGLTMSVTLFGVVRDAASAVSLPLNEDLVSIFSEGVETLLSSNSGGNLSLDDLAMG